MADTQLTQTGAQVQADLDKVEGLANIKTISSGLSLSNAGELSASDIAYSGDGTNYSSLRGNIFMLNLTKIRNELGVTNASPYTAILLINDKSKGYDDPHLLMSAYYARSDAQPINESTNIYMVIFACGIIICSAEVNYAQTTN